MALPTKGRVIIDTTVGEIDIELWSKVCTSLATRSPTTDHLPKRHAGNPQNMPKLSRTGHGGFVSFPRIDACTIF